MKLKKWMIIFPVTLLSCNATTAQDLTETGKVREYIRLSWEKTVRYNPKDSADHIGLPHPYTVPCVADRFQEMYYWDTYFTNVGLLLDGHVELAINNTENLASLIDRFGKVLNGSRFMYKNASQPPYLCMMVADIYAKTKNKGWLRKMLPSVTKEYDFWMTRRITPCGLNRYSNDVQDKSGERGMARYVKSRTLNPVNLDSLPEQEVQRYASHARAECESGWDFTPRFENRCEDYCPIDLNANLYFYERSLAYFCHELGMKDSIKKWEKAAHKRRKLIKKHMYNPTDGFFYDYDYVNNRLSPVKSAAVFSLLFAEAIPLSSARKLVKTALPALEFAHGLSATAPGEYHFTYQWSFPNGWAPLHYIAIKGMDCYGMEKDARRIAAKYVGGLTRIFQETHNLWEKYNVVNGDILVKSEGGYVMPPMIGWTAGVFEYALDYITHH